MFIKLISRYHQFHLLGLYVYEHDSGASGKTMYLPSSQIFYISIVNTESKCKLSFSTNERKTSDIYEYPKCKI